MGAVATEAEAMVAGMMNTVAEEGTGAVNMAAAVVEAAEEAGMAAATDINRESDGK